MVPAGAGRNPIIRLCKKGPIVARHSPVSAEASDGRGGVVVPDRIESGCWNRLFLKQR